MCVLSIYVTATLKQEKGYEGQHAAPPIPPPPVPPPPRDPYYGYYDHGRYELFLEFRNLVHLGPKKNMCKG